MITKDQQINKRIKVASKVTVPIQRKIIYVDNFLTTHGHTPTTGTTLVQLFKEEGYKVIATSSVRNQGLRLLDMIKTIITNKRNSIVLIATYSSAAFYFAYGCAMVCRILKIPYIPCLHGGNLPERIKSSPRLSKALFSNSYINIAVSGYLKNCMDINGWRNIEIPNNINIPAYPFKQRSIVQPCLLWVRSFHEIYNPTLAIKILHQLLQKYPGAHLTMVGPDKDGTLEKCKQLVKELKVEKEVTFTGLLKQQDWTALAKDHDIFINTTNFDNLPVSVVEAMALGLVVISTRVGGVPFLISDNENGILVDRDNVDQFVYQIERVMEDVELASSLSINARSKAQQYDWVHVKKQWKDLFQDIDRKAFN